MIMPLYSSQHILNGQIAAKIYEQKSEPSSHSRLPRYVRCYWLHSVSFHRKNLINSSTHACRGPFDVYCLECQAELLKGTMPEMRLRLPKEILRQWPHYALIC